MNKGVRRVKIRVIPADIGRVFGKLTNSMSFCINLRISWNDAKVWIMC